MRIQQAHIYGFGKWIDYTIDFSTHPFICIFGDNESGKSTIQKFILFMLFGLPPRKREFYRPKQSGRMGGRLTIHDAQLGTYTIERLDEVHNGAAKCYINGEEFGEDWLKERLNGLTEEIYHSIYSFSALDLINITNMKDEDLGDILLGIGLTGSTNIYSIEKRLNQKIGKLFKPYGKKPHINRQLETLDQILIDLEKFRATESTYHEKQTKIKSLKNQLDQLQKQLKKTKENLYTIEKKQHALPLIHDYQKSIEQLNRFPETIFPENGIERLQQLKEKLLPLKSEYRILLRNLQKIKEANEQLAKQLVDESIYKAAEEVYDEKQIYTDNKKQMLQLQQMIDEIDLQINTNLKKLNIGIDQKKLAHISFPFHIEQIWNELKASFERLTIEKEQLQNEHFSLKKQQSFLKNEQMKIEDKQLDESRIEELKQNINEYTSHQYLEKISAQSNDQNKYLKRKKKKYNYLFITSLIVSLFMIGIAHFFNKPLFYHVTFLTLMIGVSQWIFGHNSLNVIKQTIVNKQRSKLTSVNKSDEELHQMKQLLLSQDKLKSELTSVHEQLKLIDIQLIKWDEKSNLINQQEYRLQELIEEQYDQFPFLKHVQVKYWPELYHSLKHLIKMNNEQQDYINQYYQLKEKQVTIQQNLYKLLENLNIEYQQKSIIELFKIIHKAIQTQKNIRMELEQNNKQINEIQNRQTDLTEKINLYEQEISHLFSIANVTKEEDFRKNANKLQEKQALEQKVEELNEQLSIMFSEDVWCQIVKSNLSQKNLDLLEQKYTLEINELEDQAEQVRQQLADLNADLLNMESSGSYSNTMHQFYMEKEQLKKLTLDWAIYKTAKEMLVETKRSYREKYLTKVIDRTSYYFNHITKGAYHKVYAPKKNEPFQVEASDGLLFKINELSRGTIDQLYVSLRIAISEIMSSKHKLPFIIDDAFLNFDTIRLKRMLDILQELSKNQQIILFTCHQSFLKDDYSPHTIYLNSTTRIH